MVCIYVGLEGFLTFFSRHTNINQAEPSLADGEFFIESFYMHSLSRFSLLARIFPPLCRRFVNIYNTQCLAELDTLGTQLFVLVLAPIYRRTILVSNQLTNQKWNGSSCARPQKIGSRKIATIYFAVLDGTSQTCACVYFMAQLPPAHLNYEFGVKNPVFICGCCNLCKYSIFMNKMLGHITFEPCTTPFLLIDHRVHNKFALLLFKKKIRSYFFAVAIHLLLYFSKIKNVIKFLMI